MSLDFELAMNRKSFKCTYNFDGSLYSIHHNNMVNIFLIYVISTEKIENLLLTN